jgi:hypothetical protein
MQDARCLLSIARPRLTSTAAAGEVLDIVSIS